MEKFNKSASLYFYVIGLSYKKADARLRGEFSLDLNAKSNLLAQAKTSGIESLVATSTCNRTEIYFSQSKYEFSSKTPPMILAVSQLKPDSLNAKRPINFFSAVDSINLNGSNVHYN